MIVAKLPSQCESTSIYFTEQSHNASNNSTFSRIMVCDPNSIINGMYIRLPLHDIKIHEIPDWGVCKHVVQYRIDDDCNAANAVIISTLQAFESSVLQIYKNTFNVCANKTQCHHIADTLLSGNLKLGGGDSQTDNIGDNEHTVIQTAPPPPSPPTQPQQYQNPSQAYSGSMFSKILLKISGVWETDKTFGITFKYVTTAASNANE